jgi:hypothetical protein
MPLKKSLNLTVDHTKIFEIVRSALSLLLGSFAIATICGETLSPKTRPYSFDPAIRNSRFERSALSDFGSSIAPFRGDLSANLAFAYIGPSFAALNSPTVKSPPAPSEGESRGQARHLAIQSLSFSPHASDVWLLLAALTQDEDKSKIEALKMSFLTAPGDATLIAGRLLVFSMSSGIDDPDLQSLVRSDIRLVLTRRPDLKPAIVLAYRSGTPETKAYLASIIGSLDQSFAGTLPR